ncbi:hypothetical protein M3Y95_00399900 [Aphelenchoides besseyi]|nr:hypothetical protein M3Y95_00399900 [Aphelenchoides besseyi]
MNETNREELCKLAYSIHRSDRAVIVAVCHILFSILGFASICLYIRMSSIRRYLGVVGSDLKIIFWVGISYYFYEVIWKFGFSSYRLITVALNLSPCSYIWSYDKCFIAHSQGIASMWGVFLFHLALLFERFVSIFNTRQRTTCWLGLIVASFMIIAPNGYVFGNNYGQMASTNESIYCSGIFLDRRLTSKLSFNHGIAILLLDLSCTIGDFFLFLYNRRQIARYYKSVADVYTLDRSFSLRTFQISAKFIIPFSIFHTLNFLITTVINTYAILTIMDRSVDEDRFTKEYTTIMRELVICLQMFGLCAYHRLTQSQQPVIKYEERTDQADRYFLEFKRMIS